MQLTLSVPQLSDAAPAARQAYAACPSDHLETLLAFAIALVAIHEEMTGSVVVYQSVPRELAGRVGR